MKVTVHDIAERAGVSDGTVSNALNHRKGISEEKREAILKIAREMGYFKKTAKESKSLRFVVLNKTKHIIGDTPFFSELIRGIETESSALGFDLLVSHITVDENKSVDMEEVLKQDLVDGVILLGTEMNYEDLMAFEALSIPVVIVDTVFRTQKFDFVAINNIDGTYEIVSHLIDMGHQNIGLINSAYQINNFRERKHGYEQAMSDHQLACYPQNEALVEPSLDGAYSDMKEYLKSYLSSDEPLPTAYFAVNDNIALGAMKAFKEFGLEVSMVGFDDLPLCGYCDPPLTTVQVDKINLGRKAVKRLVDKINEHDSSKLQILVGTNVIFRDSVKQIIV
ncbi:LacI family DNA-binding transcriptional regulator [[Eubacterium] hominis]|uniref:LacI family DNA-binding transcriptional regulator n=1 Tax=[Eubacterium] hominis TaxID=2764325 RepID=UPI003A4E31A7